MENVEFSYDNDKTVLSNINIELKKGDIVSIVGENGCGKSTLLKIFAGLYQPTIGMYKINGINSKDIDIESFYQNISCIFQDFLEYQGSLEDNIRIANLDASQETIINALANSEITFLQENGIYTLQEQLGNWFEGGRNLSGGQWQKIALARFFVRSSSFNLLDEPSSSIDKKSESKIFKSFFKRSKQSISLFVTHRINLAKQADKIIVLKDGEITGFGTHEELLETSDYYKNLFLLEEN